MCLRPTHGEQLAQFVAGLVEGGAQGRTCEKLREIVTATALFDTINVRTL